MGQHFLSDGRVLSRIVKAAEITAGELVVEIGPGEGALTRRLIDQGAQVVAIELDRRLAASLAHRLGEPANLRVIEEDARTVDLLRLLGPKAEYKVLGNLPYYAANPIVRRFLESSYPPTIMVVTLQEEVARSMAAGPGGMGFLSVAVQYYAQPKVVCSVPPRAFRPPPKVRSAVVRLDIRPAPAVGVSGADAFFSLVRAGFASPRKQLRNSLAHGQGAPPGAIARLLEGLGIDGSRRPSTLSLEEWALLHNAWESQEKAEGALLPSLRESQEKIGNPGLCQAQPHP